MEILNLGVGDSFKGFGNVAFEVAKFAGKATVTTAAGASIVATGGLAAPLIGASFYVVGKLVKGISKDYDNKILENVGDLVEDVGINSVTGGIFSLGTGIQAVKEIVNHGQEVVDGVKVIINASETIQVGGKVYELQ
ncbi:9231_t:CDS:2 [Acaulospora morrowiae]|uniref:9231_t:CDS:1 n=1 Tax=Acaulospora morrowiae TaxID=94023 RepID=A0A9N9BPR1_9GLOM|nr:9231_t:CDS:2 [Acaulospora morrowiae]